MLNILRAALFLLHCDLGFQFFFVVTHSPPTRVSPGENLDESFTQFPLPFWAASHGR